MIYHCCTNSRKKLIKTRTDLNGIDYLELIPTNILADKQKTIHLHFIKNLNNPLLPENIFIKDGDLFTQISVDSITPVDNNTLEIKLSDRGNFSTYTLCIRKANKQNEFLPEFDKLLSSVDFSFKVECKTEIDCKTTAENCADIDTEAPPEINYLAKDYASFKQLMLDRMSFLTPDWEETNAADLGITLVEQLAYVADYLSYRQDAIGTEAYLGTSRKRISVRRHARLVDYHMHDGLNARAWLNIDIKKSSDGLYLKRIGTKGQITKFLTTGVGNVPDSYKISHDTFVKSFNNEKLVFEAMHDLQLFFEHNEISFHTYGDNNCCLPKGATHASLKGSLKNLIPGNVLIFQEIRGSETGEISDADSLHRHPIRITKIDRTKDLDFSKSPATEIDITIIHWSVEDALPFPLCVSSTISNNDVEEIKEISIAKGNVILADHGMTYTDEDDLAENSTFESVTSSLNPALVPEIKQFYTDKSSSGKCTSENAEPIYPRYYPSLNVWPITHSDTILVEKMKGSDPLPFSQLKISAKKLTSQNKRQGTPDVILFEITKSGISYKKSDECWKPVRDLLIDSSSQDNHFVLETESDGKAYFRFGNNINGNKPDSGSKFIAKYRIGNGKEGNVGRDTIHQLVYNDTLEILKISNPLPATGGIEPETKEEVKQYAPQAFRTQERAVTSEDYEAMAKKCSEDIHSVTASFRWTGSWRSAYITADRLRGKEVTADWEKELRSGLEKYRLAGVDLEIDDPHYIGLDIEMEVCILPEYLKSDIKRLLLNLFSNKVLQNGKLGFFHPDNLMFGQSIYYSQLHSIAQKVEGVISVDINKFERRGIPDSSGKDSGRLTFGRQEIARLDNDPNFRDRGVFNLIIKGGK